LFYRAFVTILPERNGRVDDPTVVFDYETR